MLEIADLQACVQRARRAAPTLAGLNSGVKDAILQDLANRLENTADQVLAANEADIADAEAAGMDEAMIDRLLLTPSRLSGMGYASTGGECRWG